MRDGSERKGNRSRRSAWWNRYKGNSAGPCPESLLLGAGCFPINCSPSLASAWNVWSRTTLWKEKRGFEGGWMHLYQAMPVAPVDCLVGYCPAQPWAYFHDWESGTSVPFQGTGLSWGITVWQCKSAPWLELGNLVECRG